MNPPPFDRLSPPAAHADEEEFDAFAQAQDPLDIEAATWALRRRNGLGAADEAALQAWLRSDPRHAAALDEMDAMLGEVQQLPSSDVAALKAGLVHPLHPLRSNPPPSAARPANPGRRQWLLGWGPLLPQAAAAALVCMAVGGGWMGWAHWRQQATFTQAFATERGQQRTVQLPDAHAPVQVSTLHLDTATRLEARLYRDRREVRLHGGQALFSVASDPGRPFHVWAGGLRITVVGTRFSVRHTASGLDAGQTVVAVEEGHVRVARARTDADADTAQDGVELTAGQMVVANGAGDTGPVSSVSAEAIAPWRTGRIQFDHTPLAQAIAEFDRYAPTGLVVRDPALAALPVGGSYSVQQWRHFAETLPQVLPVRLVRRGDRTDIVAR